MMLRKPEKQGSGDPLPDTGPVSKSVSQSSGAASDKKQAVETDEFLRERKPENTTDQVKLEDKAKQILDMAENNPEEMSSLIHTWLAQGNQKPSGPVISGEPAEPGLPNK